MRRAHRLTFLALCLMPALLLYSTASRSAAAWYQFELIVFERINADAGATEVWPTDPGRPATRDALPLRLRASANVGATDAYTPLPSSEWELTELEQRLKRSRNYRPHVHVAWRQPMTSPERARALSIELPLVRGAGSGRETPPKLEGILKVGVRRYLHLEVDLWLRRLARGENPDPVGPEYQAYRLQASRRLRSGDLHYLDHPVIGLLFLAARYQPPAPTGPADAASTAADDVSPPPAEAE